jgi:hypothetical protein
VVTLDFQKGLQRGKLYRRTVCARTIRAAGRPFVNAAGSQLQFFERKRADRYCCGRNRDRLLEGKIDC